MKTDRLYRVDRTDEDKLVELLTECFEQDPLYCQLIPKLELRNKMLPELFSCDTDWMYESCKIYADGPELNGIIVVSDETEPYDALHYFATEFFYSIKTAAYLIKEDPSCHTLMNFIRGKSYLNSEWTEEIDQDRRMHIVYFAVRPSMRGQGVAGKLMRTVLDYADQNRLVTSLETHNEKNLRMYEHYGFHVFETMQKNFALKQFCMVR